MKQIADFIESLSKSVDNQTFVKLTLSKPTVKSDLKNIYIRVIEIKNKLKLSFTYRFNTRDEVKNYDPTEGVAQVEAYLNTDFLNADLYTQASEISLQLNKKRDNGVLKIKNKNTDTSQVVLKKHDIDKKRLLDPAQPYFRALGIADAQGNITPTGQKKFKQINKYIEIIDDLIKEKGLENDAVIADFGSGKGYLTFALYDYLTNVRGMTPSVTGFELRENLVDFCNKIATECGFDNLKFVAQDINEFKTDRLDMLIALHACDIATDVAIAKSIKAKAKVVIVAPCCHKQIRKELAVKNEMQPILKYGILEERQAELLTDGIRALLLESKGYKTKVFEFISTEHTPKNVMIVGVQSKVKSDALKQVEAIKKHYGIGYHHLEILL